MYPNTSKQVTKVLFILFLQIYFSTPLAFQDTRLQAVHKMQALRKKKQTVLPLRYGLQGLQLH